MLWKMVTSRKMNIDLRKHRNIKSKGWWGEELFTEHTDLVQAVGSASKTSLCPMTVHSRKNYVLERQSGFSGCTCVREQQSPDPHVPGPKPRCSLYRITHLTSQGEAQRGKREPGPPLSLHMHQVNKQLSGQLVLQLNKWFLWRKTLKFLTDKTKTPQRSKIRGKKKHLVDCHMKHKNKWQCVWVSTVKRPFILHIWLFQPRPQRREQYPFLTHRHKCGKGTGCLGYQEFPSVILSH